MSSDVLVSYVEEEGRHWERKLQEVCCKMLPISSGPGAVLHGWCQMWQGWGLGMCGLVEPMQKWCLWIANVSIQQMKKELISHRTESNLRRSEGWLRECSGYCCCLLDLYCQGPSGLAASWANMKLSLRKPNPVFHSSVLQSSMCCLGPQRPPSSYAGISAHSLPWVVSVPECCCFPLGSADLGSRSSVVLSFAGEQLSVCSPQSCLLARDLTPSLVCLQQKVLLLPSYPMH